MHQVHQRKKNQNIFTTEILNNPGSNVQEDKTIYSSDSEKGIQASSWIALKSSYIHKHRSLG